jgi:folate-dependent phosphoribosylglycinamide formyltransferase PurN
MSQGHSLNALFLGEPSVVSMGIARGWTMAGHKISAIWYPERLTGTKTFVQDRELAGRAPGITMHGLAARSRIATRATPPLASWQDGLTEVARLKPDVILSVLFLDRIPSSVLDAYPNRVFNLHPSLLPAYRGAAPIFNMLWDRTIDKHSGMTLHLVAPAFDRGDILEQIPVAFPSDRNVTAYYMHLIKAGTELLIQSLPHFLSGSLTPQPRPAAAAPQGNRKPHEAILTSALSAEEMAWLCTTIPQLTALKVGGAPQNVRVKRFVAVLGPATEAPPVLEGRFLHMNTKDRRVQLEVELATPAER